MAKWTIIGKGHRYTGSVDNSADEIVYGYRFDLGGNNKVNVEAMEGAPRLSEREARRAVELHLNDDDLSGSRIVFSREGTFGSPTS